MRTITPAVSRKLNQRLGTEPLLLVEVEWVDGSNLLYSDQPVEGAKAILVEVGGMDVSVQMQGSSDSQQVSVTLDDTDGTLREMYTRIDMNMRPARVYVIFKDLDVTDKILLLDGQVVTPFEWTEDGRAFSFNILTRLSTTDVGFSMEEGDFPNIPEEALGQAWPLAFGQVCWLPAVQVRAPRRGYLLRGEGIVDFTLNTRICQALQIQCPSQYVGNQTSMSTGNTVTGGRPELEVTERVAPDPDCVNRRFGEICKLRDLLNQQLPYEHNTLNIYNGVSFPQGVPLVIYADGARFWGSFSGNTFTVTNRKHPKWDEWDHYRCTEVDIPRYDVGSTKFKVYSYCGQRFYSARQGGYGSFGGPEDQCVSPYDLFNRKYAWGPTDANQAAYRSQQTAEQEFENCDEILIDTPTDLRPTGGPVESWELYDSMDAADFAWLPSGTEVYIEEESSLLYIVSLLPGTVDAVAAYRTASNGQRYLSEVPTDRYTVYETNYNGYQVVEIGLTKALSLYDGENGESENWDDQLYVSFTSSVGPNTCDIIEWIIEKYTNITIDTVSFASVKTKLANYPQNFYLLDRQDALSLVQDLAFQARCGLFLRNNVLYIKYLPEEPTSERTLTESDILVNTFKEYLSETNDLFPTLKINWQKAGAGVTEDSSIEYKLVLKYNVDKYGTNTEEMDFFSYNIYDLVLKSGTFWLIRKSNSWRKVSFQVPMKHLDLDVGDCITLDIAQFADGEPIKCIIELCQYNPEQNTVTLDCWTPIRAGENTPFFWAWPSGQPCVSRWPLPGDTHGGGGYTFAITPPVGHLLLGGSNHEDQLVITSGRLNPSDLCDTVFPVVECEILDYVNFNEVTPVVEAKQIAQSGARTAMETTMGGGGMPGVSIKNGRSEDITKCGWCQGGGKKVLVTWHTSRTQGRAGPTGGVGCGGPCGCQGGCPTCTGTTWQVCHTWCSSGGATAFASYMEEQYEKKISDRWECGETAVINVGIYSGSGGGEGDAEGGGGAGSGGGNFEGQAPIGATGNETGPPSYSDGAGGTTNTALSTQNGVQLYTYDARTGLPLNYTGTVIDLTDPPGVDITNLIN